MTETTNKNAKVIWQQVEEGEGVAEPALLIEPYKDVVRIGQDGDAIQINYESIDEICKALKQIKKNRP
jgi:hypothetical protein